VLEGRSPFTGVEILPPGIRATITANGWHTTRTWTLAERRFPEGAAQLRAALIAGVATRVAPAHTITTDLSGGLDSTSITFLAAHAASADTRLIATTLRPAGHLTGDGGDGVLTAPLCYLADLARHGHVRLLLEHAAGWAQLHHHSALGLLLAAARQARRHDASPSAPFHRLLTEDDHSMAYQIRASQLLTSESGPALRWFTGTARLLAARRTAEVAPCAVTDQPIGDRAALQMIRTNAAHLRDLFGSSHLAEQGLVHDVVVRDVAAQGISPLPGRNFGLDQANLLSRCLTRCTN
jgi:hypothetical protein